MGWTFTVGVPTPSPPNLPRVTYGWAALHTFHGLLAAEEGLELSSMQDFGGNHTWQDVNTPLRLLFDLEYVNGDHPTSAYGALADRLRTVYARWSTTGPADDEVPPSAKTLQIHALENLLSVVDACIARSEHLRVD